MILCDELLDEEVCRHAETTRMMKPICGNRRYLIWQVQDYVRLKAPYVGIYLPQAPTLLIWKSQYDEISIEWPLSLTFKHFSVTKTQLPN